MGTFTKAAVCVFFVLSAAGWVYGLAQEHFGEARVDPYSDFPAGTAEVILRPGHVYSQWVNGSEMFCYEGDAGAFAEALRAFAMIGADGLVLRIEAGRGVARTFGGKRENLYDWRLDTVGGIARSYRLKEGASESELSPRLTYYIGDDVAAFWELYLPEHISVSVSREVFEMPGGAGIYEAVLSRAGEWLDWSAAVRPHQ